MTDETTVQLAAELLQRRYARSEVNQRVSAGELARVRWGAYAGTLGADPETRHLQLIRASLPRLSPEAVISHASAGVCHGLPTWDDLLSRVHITRSRSGGGMRGAVVHTHVGRLLEGEVIDLGGMRVTSAARTVLDCACTLPHLRAVAIGDAALRRGLDRGELEESLDRLGRRVGIGRARRVVSLIDGGSESVGESFSRMVFVTAGIPEPILQLEIMSQGFPGRTERLRLA